MRLHVPVNCWIGPNKGHIDGIRENRLDGTGACVKGRPFDGSARGLFELACCPSINGLGVSKVWEMPDSDFASLISGCFPGMPKKQINQSETNPNPRAPPG